MATLTSSTSFEITDAPESYDEEADLVLFPESSGIDAKREMHYPGDLFAPITYADNPDKWENFDTSPMTAKPQTKVDLTLSSVQIAQWPGYTPDKPVKEIWSGEDKVSRMDAYTLRRIYEYYANPPDGDYITWWPKDRTEQGYYIKLESVSVGGNDVISFFDPAIRNDLFTNEVVVQFRIVGEVA